MTTLYSRRAIQPGDGSAETVETSPVVYPPAAASVAKGGPIPNWEDLLKQWSQATTELQGYELEYEHVPAYAQVTYRVAGYPKDNTVTMEVYFANNAAEDGSAYDPGILNDLYRECEVAFKADAVKGLMTFEGPTWIGEILETRNMMRSPLKGLRRAFDEYYAVVKPIRDRGLNLLRRTKSTKKRRRLIKEFNTIIGNTWLEYYLGWIPLISSANSAYDAYVELIEDKSLFIVTARKKTNREEEVATRVTGKWQVEFTRTARLEADYSARIKGAIVSQPSVNLGSTELQYKRQIFERFGITLNNFVPTMWELMPYSFIIDYFSNFGDVLAAYAFRRNALRWYWAGTKAFTRIKTMTEPTGAASGFTLKGAGPGVGLRKETRVQRWIPEFEQIPEIFFEVPGNVEQWITTFCLALSKLR